MKKCTIGVGLGILTLALIAIGLMPTESVQAQFQPCWQCTGSLQTVTGSGTGSTCSEATQAANIDAHNKKDCGSGAVCYQNCSAGPCQTLPNGQKYVESTVQYRCEATCSTPSPP